MKKEITMEELYLESCILSQKIRENEIKKEKLLKSKEVQEFVECLKMDELLSIKSERFAKKYNSANKKR